MSALMFQRCRSCDHAWWLTRSACPRCGAADPTDEAASGRATLYASTRVHLTPDAALKPLLPFDIALVDLVEGPRVMAHLSATAPIGAALTGRMAMRGGRSMPVFEAVEEEP